MSTKAQETNSLQWFSLELRFKPTKNIFLDLEGAWRIAEMSETSSTFADFKAGYKIDKLRLSAGYRHTQRGGFIDADRFDHRFYSEISYREKISDLKITYRSRFQSSFSDPFSSPEGLLPEKVWRNKIQLSYALPFDMEPYISYEHFYLIINDRVRKHTDQHRFQAGFEYNFTKKSAVAIGYIYQFEVNRNQPDTDHILSVTYGYVLGD